MVLRRNLTIKNKKLKIDNGKWIKIARLRLAGIYIWFKIVKNKKNRDRKIFCLCFVL